MVKYKFTPFCPHCGEQNYYVTETECGIEKPELISASKHCRHCHKEFLAMDVIYLGKEADEAYLLTATQMEEPEFFKQWKEMQKPKFVVVSTAGIPVAPSRMLMHNVLDIAPRHMVPFTWTWNEMLLEVVYTLKFEYQGQAYEIFAPMSDDHTITYLPEFIELARKMVDDYLDKIDVGGRLG